MVITAAASVSEETMAWNALRAVTDPEIPVLSVVDLGLVRHVKCMGKGDVEVGLAPTYSGCPATAVIRGAVVAALRAAGFSHPSVVEILSPPWTSAWLSTEALQKLRQYGIAPPKQPIASPGALWGHVQTVPCPRCDSLHTEELSAFGSTPCKALHRCKSCLEPFEYFKCI
jgi:ring-1,2-phenylacetyl-CoA epoxidase subunit PaaD